MSLPSRGLDVTWGDTEEFLLTHGITSCPTKITRHRWCRHICCHYQLSVMSVLVLTSRLLITPSAHCPHRLLTSWHVCRHASGLTCLSSCYCLSYWSCGCVSWNDVTPSPMMWSNKWDSVWWRCWTASRSWLPCSCRSTYCWILTRRICRGSGKMRKSWDRNVKKTITIRTQVSTNNYSWFFFFCQRNYWLASDYFTHFFL